jgi:hypothetical protein
MVSQKATVQVVSFVPQGVQQGAGVLRYSLDLPLLQKMARNGLNHSLLRRKVMGKWGVMDPHPWGQHSDTEPFYVMLGCETRGRFGNIGSTNIVGHGMRSPPSYTSTPAMDEAL